MTPTPPPSVARYLSAALGSADGPTDADLLGRFAAGRDQAAFELLVWRHAGMVLRTSRAVLRDHHTAEDVTQAAFLALARKAGSIGRREAVAGWLYRVARRLAVRTAARRRVQPKAVAHVADVPTAAADWDDGSQVVHDELARLPDRYRAPVLLCYFEGLSHADAARRLGWPVGSVAGRLARAKTLLHDRLTRRGVAVPAVGVGGLVTADAVGAVPGAFADGTARAAVLFAAGAAVVPDVSPFTLELAKGAVRAMTITKLQWAAGVLAACGALTAGGVWATGQGPPGPGGGLGLPGSPGNPVPATVTPQPAEKPAAPVRTADYDQRRRSLNNLKQLMIAVHNYEAAYGKLPADIADQSGKPLLSWRIELLPFLEQTPLYSQFKRDQPWDSEHNLKLLSKMPDTLRVGFEPKDTAHTYYQRFKLAGMNWPAASEGGGPGGPGGSAPGAPGPGGAAGMPGGPGMMGPGGSGAAPGTAGPPGLAPGAAPPGVGGPPGGFGGGAPALAGGPPGMGAGPGAIGGMPGVGRGPGPVSSTDPRFPVHITDITDGTSNTLCLAEVGPPVPWTKPADVVVDVTAPVLKLTGPFSNVLHVAAYDGATYAFRPDIAAATFGAGPAVKIHPDILVRLIHPSDGAITPPLGFFKAKFAAETAEEKAGVARLEAENRNLVADIAKALNEQSDLLDRPGAAVGVDQVEIRRDRLKQLLAELQTENDRLRGLVLASSLVGKWVSHDSNASPILFKANGTYRVGVARINTGEFDWDTVVGTYSVTADGVVRHTDSLANSYFRSKWTFKDRVLTAVVGPDQTITWKKEPVK